MQNRLNLDFKVEGRPERLQYVRDYLSTIKFTPNEHELDVLAKYILWGKDPETGLNGRQEGLELETVKKTWDTQQVESLDALIETPGFSETMLRRPTDPPTRIPREVFSREKTRRTAPSHLLPIFEALWRNIDSTELKLNYYELAHGRRKKEPRAELVARFSAPELAAIHDSSTHLSSYNYLKLKHELVDLRREQYLLKDEYAPVLQILPSFDYEEYVNPSYLTFGEGIPVLPLGIPSNKPITSKVFNLERYPEPNDFSEKDLEDLSALLWTPVDLEGKRFFDFRQIDHLHQLYGMWDVLNREIDQGDGLQFVPLESNLSQFLRAAAMYRTLAGLTPLLDDIVSMKIEKKSNQEIADYINKTYGKKYHPNYISALYYKKCLASIAAAASTHREVLENCFFPENFKKCKDCGKVLLMNEQNFVRRKHSNDGFSPRCKRCEKIARDAKKQKETK